MAKLCLLAAALLGVAYQVAGLQLSASVTPRLGRPVTITCTGNPLERNLELTSPDGTVSRSTNGVIRRQIPSAEKKDAGLWRCTARSTGIVSVSMRVKLTSTSERLSAQLSYSGPSSLGGQLVLDCKVTGPADLNVAWYKDDRRIVSDSRIRTSESARTDGRHYLLTIDRTLSSDAGSYRCEARGGSGVARTSATVFFSGNGGSTRPPVLTTSPSAGGSTKTTSRAPTVVPSTAAPSQRLSVRLSYSGPSPLGRSLLLDCKVTGPADVTVYWYKDGRRIFSDSRIRTLESTRTDGRHYLLTISRTLSSDAGSYRCEARSGFSFTRTSVRVYFSGNGGRSTRPPVLTTRPSAGERLSARISYRGPSTLGRQLSLDCRVTGPADLSVTWYKDGRRIFPSARITTTSVRTEGRHYLLTIARALSSDAGSYRCEARRGSNFARASVTVSFSGSVRPPVTRSTATVPLFTTPPRFNQPLSARISYTGPSPLNEPLVLECRVTGLAWAFVSWYKDNRRIFWNSRMRTSSPLRSDGRHYLLTIFRPVSSDAGNYRCEVRSGFRVIRTSVNVYFSGSNVQPVTATSKPPISTSRPETSGRVSARLTSYGIATQGQRLIFDCKVTVPEGATVTFTKDLVPLSSSSGHTLTRQTRADGLHYLYLITSLQFTDSGRYRCEVRSKTGSTAKSERQLSVRGVRRWSWWTRRR